MGPAADPPRTPFFPTALLVTAAILIASLPRSVNEDSWRRDEALNELLSQHTAPGTKYSLIGPLAATPLWLLGNAVGNPESLVYLFNRLVFLAGAAGLWWALRPALAADVGRRFLLLLAFASMAASHLMSFGGEVFTAVGVGVGTAAAIVRGARWGWPLAALAAANAPATIPALALAAGVACWQRRQLRTMLAPAAAAGLVLLENWLRRGHPLAGGYSGEHGSATALPYSGLPGFSYPFFFGLLSILLSFGKGLVFFVPGLFVPFGSERGDERPHNETDLRLLYRVWLAFVIGLALVYARWWAWYAGVCWGPRFFLFACLPACLVLARRTSPPFEGRFATNLLLLAVLALSCWVGADGAVYQQYGDEAYFADGYALEFVTWYVPECSPLWRPFVVPRTLTAAEAARLAVFAAAAAYLLAHLAVVVARQTRDGICRMRAAVRNGPRFRF